MRRQRPGGPRGTITAVLQPLRSLAYVTLAIILGCVGCGDTRSDSAEVAQSVKDRYSDAATSDKLLPLADVTSFDWDTFHVFGPYTTMGGMNESLGFRWKGSRDLRTDSYQLIVWVLGGAVVESVLVSVGDVSFPVLPDGIAKEKAVFASLIADNPPGETVVLTLPD